MVKLMNEDGCVRTPYRALLRRGLLDVLVINELAAIRLLESGLSGACEVSSAGANYPAGFALETNGARR
jgi:hypothetical protein